MGCAAAPPGRPRGVREVRVVVTRGEDDVLGARMGSKGGITVILGVDRDGLLSEWNELHPDLEVRSGDLLLAVNGCIDFIGMMKEAQGYGEMDLRILPGPQARLVMQNAAGLKGSPGVHSLFQSFQLEDYNALLSTTAGPTLLSRQMVDSLPQVRAADVGMDECSVCLQDLDPDEMLLSLPCSHSFHKACAVKWLCEGKRSCPLCQRKLRVTPSHA